MTTWKRNTHVGPLGSEMKRILHNSKTGTAESTPIYETDSSALLPRSRCVNDLLQDNFDGLPEEAVNNHVKGKPQGESITKKNHFLSMT